ncbi:hypothetical protein MX099_05470 [Streptococcus uberis]|nr:hypothetical protein [Streptococcus uberis]MCK1257331.1 hypothetical protein [Streptococcus uberis]
MALSTRDIKSLGSQISDILPRIELMQLASDTLILANDSKTNAALLKNHTTDILRAISEQTQQLQRELDLVACKLLNCDDDNELEEIKRHE